MSKPTQRLARGLSALVTTTTQGPQPVSNGERTTPAPSEYIRQIPVEQIRPNPRQPRSSFEDTPLAELAESIRLKGVLQPILVRPSDGDSFELIAGERRWRAAQMAGLPTIPAVTLNISDAESFETALVENLQREDLGPLERALAYQQYMELFGGTLDDLASRLGDSRPNVSNYLRLLKLHPEVCYLLGKKELGMGQARAVAGISDPQRQLALARLAARRNLSVRQVEELARRESEAKAEVTDNEDTPEETSAGRHVRDVERTLSKAIGLRVRVTSGRRKNSGRVIITFATLDDFDRIVERLGAEARME